MRRRAFVIVAVLAALTAALVATSISTAAPISYPLYAGQTTLVGDVEVSNDATNLSVVIDLADGWCMTESKVAVASEAPGIPQTSTGNPKPGQFLYKATHSPCVDASEYTIPFAGLGTTPVIAVHLTVWDEASDTCSTIVSNAGPSNRVAVATTYPSFGGAVDALVTPGYAGWPSITGASYISNQTAGDPFGNDVWRKVTETLAVPGLPISGQLWVNSDNYEFTKLNGTEIQRDDGSPTSTVENTAAEVIGAPQTWATIENVGFAPVMGTNSFEFVFRNVSWEGGGSFVDNPAGLIYKATACYYARSETAWADGGGDFPGANWATYINYTLQDVLLETVTVPSTAPLGVNSVTSLASDKSYFFKVTGTTTWLNRGGYDVVDAECVNTNNGGWLDYVVDYPDETLLELQVDLITREWVPVGSPSSEGCDANHVYTLPFTGAGATVNFRIYDGIGNVQIPGWFDDNSGSLTVEIWLDL